MWPVAISVAEGADGTSVLLRAIPLWPTTVGLLAIYRGCPEIFSAASTERAALPEFENWRTGAPMSCSPRGEMVPAKCEACSWPGLVVDFGEGWRMGAASARSARIENPLRLRAPASLSATASPERAAGQARAGSDTQNSSIIQRGAAPGAGGGVRRLGLRHARSAPRRGHVARVTLNSRPSRSEDSEVRAPAR